MLISRIFNNNKYQISYLVSNNESEQRNFAHLIRYQTKSEAIHNIKHVKKACYRVIMRKTKNKVPMNKPYNIQNTNICNGIFHISFLKALLINEGETTRGEREYRPRH
jgi:hypothetical protein